MGDDRPDNRFNYRIASSYFSAFESSMDLYFHKVQRTGRLRVFDNQVVVNQTLMCAQLRCLASRLANSNRLIDLMMWMSNE